MHELALVSDKSDILFGRHCIEGAVGKSGVPGRIDISTKSPNLHSGKASHASLAGMFMHILILSRVMLETAS
jgi:hypothetical protein